MKLSGSGGVAFDSKVVDPRIVNLEPLVSLPQASTIVPRPLAIAPQMEDKGMLTFAAGPGKATAPTLAPVVAADVK